jgi:hypothetical protein
VSRVSHLGQAIEYALAADWHVIRPEFGRAVHNRELADQTAARGETMERIQKTSYPPTSLRADGITHVGLKVSDVKRSGQFYREILGPECEPRDWGIVYVSSGRDRLVLYEEGKGATDFHFGSNLDPLRKSTNGGTGSRKPTFRSQKT